MDRQPGLWEGERRGLAQPREEGRMDRQLLAGGQVEEHTS